MTGRAERQARRLMVAYPWRVRAEQGDEIVGTVLDDLPSDARRLPVRTMVDLVRGGWRVRSRRRPPLTTVIAYWLGFRISPRWIQWVYDDLEHPGYVRVHRWRAAAEWFAICVAMSVLLRDPLFVFYASGGIVVAAWRVPRDREQRRARFGLTAGGSDPRLVWVRRQRAGLVPHVAIAPLALAVGSALTAGAAACTAAMASSDPRSEDWGLDVTIHPAIHLGERHLVTGVLGLLLGLVVALTGTRRSRRAGTVAPIAAPRATVVAAVLAAGGVAVAAGILAAAMAWRWAPAWWAHVIALVGPLGVGLVALGARTAWTGRMQGHSVGVWEILPRLGPRRRVEVVSRHFLSMWPDAEIVAHGDDDL